MSDLTSTSSTAINADKAVDEESVEEESSWWSYTTSIARSIKEQIPSQTKNAYFGIADAINQATSVVVAEFAQMEIEAEREARRWRRERGYYSDDEDEEKIRNSLPWEISTNETDEVLKEKILALSCDDKTFYSPFDNNTSVESVSSEGSLQIEDSQTTFDLESHVSVIRKLLQIDPNLADVHARLSGSKIKEQVFWHNYFYHCLRTQIDHRSSQTEETEKIPFVEVKNNIVRSVSKTPSEDDDIVNIPSPPRSARSIGDLVVVGSIEGQNTVSDDK